MRSAHPNASTHAERVYLPQLFLIQAAIARGRGPSAVAHASARRAVAEARAQQAPWLELIALLELCECNRAQAQDRHALAALVKQLPGASDPIAVTSAALQDEGPLKNVACAFAGTRWRGSTQILTERRRYADDPASLYP
jgi:hypothetical protein